MLTRQHFINVRAEVQPDTKPAVVKSKLFVKRTLPKSGVGVYASKQVVQWIVQYMRVWY